MKPEEPIALLQALWPCDGWGELRILRGAEMLKPLFLKLPLTPKNLNPALEWCHKNNENGGNVYFGVHCRVNPRGRNTDVPIYTCLIADIDNVEASWPLIKQLQDVGCPASICVRTPRGLHLYWLLREPESTEGPARTRMQRLQKAILSDAVHDPARILRLPGAKCHKAGNGSLVHIAWFNPDVRYTSEEIDKCVTMLWPDVVADEPAKDAVLTAVSIPLQDMPADVWAIYAAPAAKGTRSELCLSFIQHALMLGWTPENIYAALEKIPIGGHYLDRGTISAPSAFMYDLTKAQRNVSRTLHTSTRVVVNKVSIYENPPVDNLAPGIRKLKVYFVERNRFGYGATFLDWITIPDQWRTDKSRWFAFLSAVGLSVNDNNPVENLLEQLPGRNLRVNFRDDNVQRIKFFLPDVAM